jgi:hypothetical protein
MLIYKEGMSKEDRYISATKDHKHPKNLGGTNERDNYVVACARCNQVKASIPYQVFKIFADMVLIPYPNLPLPIIRNSLNQYVMHLLDMACSNKQTMRNACTLSLLNLVGSIESFGGYHEDPS